MLLPPPTPRDTPAGNCSPAASSDHMYSTYLHKYFSAHSYKYFCIFLTCEALDPGQVVPGLSRPASARLPPQFQRLTSRPVTGASQPMTMRWCTVWLE